MAYQALYRKYRPETFSDVAGQEHITETLKNQLATGKTVHAYLFTGTRGTGKTSCAKILAKAVNCLKPVNGDPCLECESCRAIASGENTDIVEIDAASNNSVDSIRELRELLNFTPSASKYRVYIIDEVHMLTISAFNALLKTLEEPPSHVIFILATTEVHKLPATILSRCQRFDFRRIDNSKICERIHHIASKEGFSVTDDAATLIAAAADGGMRDALSILDLCASANRTIDEAVVENVCAMAGNDYLLELANCIKGHDAEQALMLIDRLHNSSVDILRLLNDLTLHYRDLMIVKTVKSKNRPIVSSKSKTAALENQAEDYDIKDIMYCLKTLQSTFATIQNGNRRCEIEMAIIKMCDPSLSVDIEALERRISALENGIIPSPKRAIVAPNAQPAKPMIQTEPEVEDEIPLPNIEDVPASPEEQNIETPPAATPSASDGPLPVAEWDKILKKLTTDCPLIAGVLKGSKAYTKGSYLLIDAPNTQFRSLINSGNPLYKDSIRKAAFAVLGNTYKLGPYTAAEKTEEADPLTLLAQRLKNLEIN